MDDELTVFVKTIIPSRKATKQYSAGKPAMTFDADEKELLDSVGARRMEVREGR